MAHRNSSLSLGARIGCALAAIAAAVVAFGLPVTESEARLAPAGEGARIESLRHEPPAPAAKQQREPAGREQAQKQKPSESKPKLAEVRNTAGEPLDVSDETCRENLAIAAKQGLLLPDGWKLHCVGPGLDWNGGSHWGVTCPYAECPEGAGPYVSISNPTYYVVAHELCHANFGNDELMADRCAAEHGASLETSPYS